MAEDGTLQVGTGARQSGLRDHNERLILSMINRLGAAPGSELARMAGLSAQTVSVILRSLESDGLVEKGKPQKGRVGKPSVPMHLAADGAFSLGLKIGRRSADFALMDFHGKVRSQIQTHYRYPLPDTITGFLRRGLDELVAPLPGPLQDRVCGIGVAAPFEIWKWADAIGAPPADFAAWQDFDLVADIGVLTGKPVTLINDATAACMAENAYAEGPRFADYVYLFVGSFIGGGVVFGGEVFDGPHGNAGAFGSMHSVTHDGRPAPLLETASLYLLEDLISERGGDPTRLWVSDRDWSAFAPQVETWIDRTGTALARAILSACAIIDFEAAIVDGAFPPDVRARLVDDIRQKLSGLDSRGLVRPVLQEGRLGENARALGAAYAPIAARYLVAASP